MSVLACVYAVVWNEVRLSSCPSVCLSETRDSRQLYSICMGEKRFAAITRKQNIWDLIEICFCFRTASRSSRPQDRDPP